MGSILTWFFLQLKRMLIRPSFWVEMAVIIALITMINTLQVPEYSNLNVGYASSSFKPDFSGSSLNFVLYSDKEELRDALVSGRVDCGFYFDEDFSERLETGDFKGSILCMTTPFSIKAEVAKETVYAAILKESGRKLIRENIREIYPDDKDAAEALLDEKYEKKLAGTGLLKVDTLMTMTPEEVTNKPDLRFFAKLFILVLSGLYIIVTEKNRILPYYKPVSFAALLLPVVLLGIFLL